MRRLIAVVSALVMAVAGAEFAHEVAYRLVARGADARAHLLAETGHAYLRWLPLALAVMTVIVALAFVLEAGASRSGRPGRAPRPSVFLAVAPATFVLQEHFERLLHDGAFPWGAVGERTFVVGLVLQVPVALLAFGVAWVLFRSARLVALLRERPVAVARGCRGRWRPEAVEVGCSSFGGRPHGARAPPLLMV